MFDEQAFDQRLVMMPRPIKRSQACPIRQIRRHTDGQHRLQAGQTPLCRRQGQWMQTRAIVAQRIGLRRQQNANNRRMIEADGFMQCRGPVVASSVNISPGLQQRADDAKMASCRRHAERRPPLRPLDVGIGTTQQKQTRNFTPPAGNGHNQRPLPGGIGQIWLPTFSQQTLDLLEIAPPTGLEQGDCQTGGGSLFFCPGWAANSREIFRQGTLTNLRSR